MSLTPPAGRGSTAVRLNIWLLRAARNWLKIALTIIGIYVSLPFAAPTLMHVGATGPAQIIYTLYSPFCHQFAFRTVFLWGEQPFYPRETALTGGLRSFDSYASQLPEFNSYTDLSNPLQFARYQLASRAFLGNEQMGYKMTLCARDISIYLGLFIGGLGFALVRNKLRPVPLLLYIWLGLGPIGLDGFSQLLGYPPFNFWPPRETLPQFRILTGAIFGLMNVWLGFPYLERSMQETRQQIEDKLLRAGIRV